MARIIDVSTAVPAHRYTQREIKELCVGLFPDLLEDGRRAEIFDRAGVDARRLVEPAEYYLGGKDFETKNRDYLKHALELSETCIGDVLNKSRLGFQQLQHVVSVTTTGLLTPSLEARLAQALPFPRTIKRTPIFGVGCAGGAVALARASDYLAGRPEETALVLSVELCSLTFLPEEQTMTQVVAAALFGDGAAAVVLSGDDGPGRARAEILRCESRLLPDSLDVMGWDFTNEGMRLMLSPRAPELIEANFRGAAERFLEKEGLCLLDIGVFLLHPGSGKILESCERALSLTPEATRLSRRFLAENGNLSSASLLFILRAALEEERPAPGTLGLMAAFGPGFSCEMLLVRFY